jgi:ubiquinone/menaquinone biosynthesis C-methylase UbiE
MSSPITSNYVLGQSDHEYERLMLQARILRPYTEKFFRAAGLAPGMRVLEVGSGMGDVALLSADIVGPGGHVLGIDRDATALDRARRRTDEQGCSSWVEFQASDLDEFAITDQFDALVGRYVLLYQPDPSSTIRSLLRSVKLGGIIVFHEFDFHGPHASYPSCPLFDQVCWWARYSAVAARLPSGGGSARRSSTQASHSQLSRQKSSSVEGPVPTCTLGLPTR